MSSRSLHWLWAGLTLWMALSGCRGGGSLSTIPCPESFEPCDVNQGQCQKRVFVATACQREQDPGNLPRIREITVAELRDELSQASGMMAVPDAWDVGLDLLGLVKRTEEGGSGLVDVVVDGILAFYDFRTKEVTLLSDAADLDPFGKNLVLSHEFVHVLQDRAHSLAAFARATTVDGSVANDALLEGEAVTHSAIVVSSSPPEEIGWETYFENLLAGTAAEIDGSTAPLLTAAFSLPYPVGGQPVSDLWLAEGQQGVRPRYREKRITSLVDWLEGYPGGLGRGTGRLQCEAPDAPAGYELFGEDIFGATGVIALAAAQGQGALQGLSMAADWRGGRTWTYARGGDDETPPQGTLLLWQSVWESADAANAFAQLMPEEQRFVREDAVLVVATDEPELLALVAGEVDSVLQCRDGLDGVEKSLRPPARRGKPWLPRLGLQPLGRWRTFRASSLRALLGR